MPTTDTKQESRREVAENLVRTYCAVIDGVRLTSSESALVDAIEAALNAQQETERDRITTDIAKMYWHFDCGSERDTVLAIPHLPSCTCMAASNVSATEYQHHHNSCPVYVRVMAIRNEDASAQN